MIDIKRVKDENSGNFRYEVKESSGKVLATFNSLTEAEEYVRKLRRDNDDDNDYTPPGPRM